MRVIPEFLSRVLVLYYAPRKIPFAEALAGFYVLHQTSHFPDVRHYRDISQLEK